MNNESTFRARFHFTHLRLSSSSSLVSLSWVDFTLTPELNSGCRIVLNENRGHCRALSFTQSFFFFFFLSAFVCLITLMWKNGHITNLVMLCALCDPHLNQALFNNATLKWKACSVTCFWSKWSHFLASWCSKKVSSSKPNPKLYFWPLLTSCLLLYVSQRL